MSEALKVLIVGCGDIAGRYRDDGRDPDQVTTHAGAYTRHPAFALAACVDPDEGRRAEFQRRWAVPAGFADLDAALAAGSYDVVSVCTPTGLHAGHLERVLGIGAKAVFAEKPVAADLADAERLVRRYAEDGPLLAVNHLRRWTPGFVELRDRLASGELGRLHALVARYCRGVLNNGTHMIDALRFLTGREIRLVALGAVEREAGLADPTVDALLELDDGTPVHLVAGRGADFSLFEISLSAERGLYDLERAGSLLRERSARENATHPGYRELAEPTERSTGLGRSMLNAVDNIAAAIRSGVPLASTGESALSSMRLCAFLAEEAVKKGTTR